MTDAVNDVETFYEDHPDLYDVIGRDRDFSGQLGMIEALSKPRGTDEYFLLELFAGPAYHSIELMQRHRQSRAFAVDLSGNMKTTALKNGFLPIENYIVGKIPEAIKAIPARSKFHSVLALRYSMGYLSRSQVRHLFAVLRHVLHDSGTIFIELHNLRLIRKSLEELSIRERRIKNDCGDELICWWPDGEIAWSDEDNLAKMTISIRTQSKESPQTYRFLSQETIYSAKEIQFIASLEGLETKVIAGDAVMSVFPDSKLLALRKSGDFMDHQTSASHDIKLVDLPS